MLTRIVIHALARWHRTLLVAATAILAIGASLVATTSPPLRAWLWLVGGMILLYTSDVGREVESTARRLSTSTGTPPDQVRSEVFEARSSRWLAVLAIGSIGLII